MYCFWRVAILLVFVSQQQQGSTFDNVPKSKSVFWCVVYPTMKPRFLVAAVAASVATTGSCVGEPTPEQTAAWAMLLFDDQSATISPAQHQPLVNGSLPTWLSGSLIRVGPALWDLPHRNATHNFDGLAKISRWTFGAGGVSHSGADFTDRFLETDV